MAANKVVDYNILRGHPADVEAQVKRYLKKGWQLNGEMLKLTVHPTNVEIILQCMIKEQ